MKIDVQPYVPPISVATYHGNAEQRDFAIAQCESIVSVEVDGEPADYFKTDPGWVRFEFAPSLKATIVVTYRPYPNGAQQREYDEQVIAKVRAALAGKKV